MEHKENSTKKKEIIGKAWPVILCLLLSGGVFLFLLNMETKQLAKYEKGYVVIAAEDVKKHTEITKDNIKELFQVAERPLTDIPKASYLELDGLLGQYVTADIDKGSMITGSMTATWVDETGDMVYLGINMEALEKSVVGTLRAGDIIDIYTVETGTDEEVIVKKVIEKVTIIRSYTASGGSILKEDPSAIAQFITIPVHKDAVEGFYASLERKKLQIVKYPE